MTAGPVISAAGPGFAPLLSTLDQRCFGDMRQAWSPESVAQLLEMPSTHGFLMAVAGDPVAYAVLQHAGPELEILMIGVLPEHRQQGLGRVFMDYLIAWGRERGAESVLLDVAEDNEPAKALYGSLGFKLTATRKNYYSRRASGDLPLKRLDALLMSLHID